MNSQTIQNMITSGWTWPRVEIYEDSANNAIYYCDTLTCNINKADNLWRVRKVIYNNSTFDRMLRTTFAYNPVSDKEGASFIYPATSLAVVSALQYNFS